jgi:anaerobic selenocysteine-containing dehydrogenase
VVRSFVGPETLLDLGLRFGPYGAKLNPLSSGLTLKKVKRAVHGIDLGPLTPCLPERLRTSNKRINLAPDVFLKDVERVKKKYLQANPNHLNDELVLIGRRQLRSNNSWLHNSQRLLRGKPQCTLLMHPVDAAQRNLKSTQIVIVKSLVGSVKVPLEVSDEVMQGVVSIPHGWGHDRSGVRLSVAREHAGESINDLTDNQFIDALSGTAAFSGIRVTVEARSDQEQPSKEVSII